MKCKIHSALVNLYGLVVAVAVLAGFVVGVLFLIAFIFEGQVAVMISEFNLTIMNISKKLACYAVLIGLLDFYLMKEHQLTVEQKEDNSMAV